MTSDNVRVRYAPSPTGPQHIGGVRTALFNWLFARHHGGKFLLRIEDTDQKRFVEGAEQMIYDALDWLGLDVDEGPHVGGDYGPYRQSERLEHYQKWAKWLVENDKAYYDYTTPKELDALREEQKARKEPPGYDRRHRDIGDAERAKLKAEGRPEVVRFKMPLDGQTTITDMIRGEVTFDNDQLQDLVLLKSDGFPTYHLANVVDDHMMKITHIMRANEWLNSAPLHAQLYSAFGWEMPQIVHLPVLLNPNGKGKLSKRSIAFDEGGKKVPVLVHEFAELGYLPEATQNFLTNIGWAFGDDREMFSSEEAIARFKIEDVNPSNSAYPIDKLDWLNGKYIREVLSVEDLTERLRKPLQDAGLTVDDDILNKVVPVIQTRIEKLTDVVDLTDFFFKPDFEPAPAEEHIQKKMDAASTKAVLEASHKTLSALDDFSPEAQEEVMRAMAKENGWKAGQVFGTLRVAVTAKGVAPPLFDTLAIVGKEKSLERIAASSKLMDTLIETAGD